MWRSINSAIGFAKTNIMTIEMITAMIIITNSWVIPIAVKTLSKLKTMSSCMRAFQTDEKGKEHTMSFNTQNFWLCDYKWLYLESTGSISSDALADSQVLAFNMLDLECLYVKHPELATVGRGFLQRHVATLHDRILDQLRLTAKERYDLFLKKYAHIEQIAANRYIASYLGITQVIMESLK